MKALRGFGPGLLLAATSIGASHLLLAPEAGARFGHRLLWLVLAVHLLKYPAFAFAPRYVAARDESLLDAYARAPGPKGWALWLGLVDMSVQAIGLIAALVGLTATFLVAATAGTAFSTIGVPAWSLLLSALLLALLALGRYTALRRVNGVLLALLGLGTFLATMAAAPDPGAMARGFVPSLPAGSLLLVAAIAGFMPTSVAVSIWQSLWAIEQRRDAKQADPDVSDTRLDRLRRGVWDLRIGYGLSVALAVAFMALGAELLQPRGLVPEGPEVAIVLSQLYTNLPNSGFVGGWLAGDWMRSVVLTMAFAALFTTCYTMMDGFPRSFVAARRVLRGRALRAQSSGDRDLSGQASDGGVDRAYWSFLLVTTFGGMATLALVPDPALLVKWVGAIGLLFSPVYYTLNLWAVTRLVADPSLRPGPALRALAVVGIAALCGIAGLLVWTLVT